MATSKRGRPKGSRNKVTNEAKQAMLMAFDKIGGAERLAEWILADPANETLWWTRMWPKLLPRPAIETAPAPEALPPVRGALIFKTPDWAKQPRRKDALKAGVAAAAAAVDAVRTGVSACGPPDDGPPPPGWVADG